MKKTSALQFGHTGAGVGGWGKSNSSPEGQCISCYFKGKQ